MSGILHSPLLTLEITVEAIICNQLKPQDMRAGFSQFNANKVFSSYEDFLGKLVQLTVIHAIHLPKDIPEVPRFAVLDSLAQARDFLKLLSDTLPSEKIGHYLSDKSDTSLENEFAVVLFQVLQVDDLDMFDLLLQLCPHLLTTNIQWRNIELPDGRKGLSNTAAHVLAKTCGADSQEMHTSLMALSTRLGAPKCTALLMEKMELEPSAEVERMPFSASTQRQLDEALVYAMYAKPFTAEQLALIKKMIEQGANLNTTFEVGMHYLGEVTALTAMAEMGRTDCIRAAFEHDSKMKGVNLSIALSQALCFLQDDVVETILAQEPTLTDSDDDGELPFLISMAAMSCTKPEIIKKLLHITRAQQADVLPKELTHAVELYGLPIESDKHDSLIGRYQTSHLYRAPALLALSASLQERRAVHGAQSQQVVEEALAAIAPKLTSA